MSKSAFAAGAGTVLALALAAWTIGSLYQRSRQMTLELPVLVTGDALAVGLAAAVRQDHPDRVYLGGATGEALPETVRRFRERLAQRPAPQSVVVAATLEHPEDMENLRNLAYLRWQADQVGLALVILGPPPLCRGASAANCAAATELRAALAGGPGVIDLWPLLGDPDDPSRYREGYSDDGLNPNARGYRVLADYLGESWR